MHPEPRLSHNWLVRKLHNDMLGRHLACLHGTVVDLGCGTRPHEDEIRGHADRYVGIDWSNTPHELRADIAADLNRVLPVRDEVADCVVSFQVIEHLAEPGMMLNEAWRILKHDGLLMLSVPFQWWVHEAPWDYQRFTRYGLQYQLEKAGFTKLQIVPLSGFWSMWLLKLNYQTVRLIRGPRPVRLALRTLLVPFWWLAQVSAPVLDKYWKEENETLGYFVTARKP
jgi:SAM-dependent methyltransferase